MQLKNVKDVILNPISKYILELINNFGYRTIALDMQPVVQYFLNTVLLSMCGAFEEKVETCKYYIAGFDLQSRYDFLKSVSKSEYKSRDIIAIMNQFRQINDLHNETKSIVNIYDDYKRDVYKFLNDKLNFQGEGDNRKKKTVFVEYVKSDFNIFDKKWLNICDYKENSVAKDKAQILKIIYDGLYLNRHMLAHNLTSLYFNNIDFSDIASPLYFTTNFFIKIALLICFDLDLMSIMNEIFGGHY